MKRVLNFRVVEGDPNEIDKNEILLVRDNSTGKVKSIRERGSDGSLKELISNDSDNSVKFVTADKFALYVIDSASTSSGESNAKVANILPFGGSVNSNTLKVDITSLVNTSDNYKLQFHFIVAEKDKFGIGDTIGTKSYNHWVSYVSEDDEQENPKLVGSTYHYSIIYYNGNMVDPDAEYIFRVMIVLGDLKGPVYMLDTRMIVDTNSLK